MRVRISILIIVTAFAAVMSRAEVLYVDGDFQGETYNGSSWLSAFPTVQEAINAAKDKETEIWVKGGVYKPSGESRDSTFALRAGIRLYGGFRGNETEREQRNWKANRTILTGDIGQPSDREDNCYHVLMSTVNTVVDGFIIAGGNANGADRAGMGGGIHFRSDGKISSNDEHSSLVINCSFEKNMAIRGGAIYSHGAAPSIKNCTFYNNSAENGGAVSAHDVRHAVVADSIFTSNFAEKQGGAVHDTDSGVVYRKCTFMLNSAGQNGGGVHASAVPANIRPAYLECAFSKNNAKGYGGAMAQYGSFTQTVAQCTFTSNVAGSGGGAIASRETTAVNVFECKFRGNHGGAGLADIHQDENARLYNEKVDMDELLNPPPKPKPVPPKPKPEEKKTSASAGKDSPVKVAPKAPRQIDDVYVYNLAGVKMKLRTIVGAGDYTVLMTGCLTDPDFLKKYGGMEAVCADFSGIDGVNFFYIYKALSHPENHGYQKPYTHRERGLHVRIAQKKLRTKMPWLYDTMGNQAFAALGKASGGVAILDMNGRFLYSSSSFNERAVRSKLEQLLGQADQITSELDLALPEIAFYRIPENTVLKRLKLKPDDLTRPLEIVPQESRMPYYVKVRAEANADLLKTGSGRMYLGFHIDPIYQTSWNNLDICLKYKMMVPRRTAISPSVNESPKISTTTDRDPREFLLEVRNWRESQPVQLTVTYSVHSDSAKWTRNVTQYYLLYLKQDDFGGSVISRHLKTFSMESAAKQESSYTPPVMSRAPVKPKKSATPPKAKTAVKTSTTAPAKIPSYSEMLEEYDKDKDGTMSKSEVPFAVNRIWTFFDRNRDEKLEQQEYVKYMRSFDRNNDGKVDSAQQRRFNSVLDRNNDGKIDERTYAAPRRK